MSFADNLRKMTVSKEDARNQDKLEKAKQAMDEQQVVLQRVSAVSDKIIGRIKHDMQDEARKGNTKIKKSYGFYGEDIAAPARIHIPPKWAFDELAKTVREKLEQEGFKAASVSWRHYNFNRGECNGYYLDVKAKW